MSLAARSKTPPTLAQPGTPCSVGRLLAELPKAEAGGLREMLDAPWRVWPHSEIEKALEAEGHRFGQGQVGRHRRKTCRCADVSR